MKSLNFKKFISYLAAYSSAFLFFCNLNSAKVTAMPEIDNFISKSAYEIDPCISFTLEDMKNFSNILISQGREAAINNTPHFKNLLSTDPNVDHWLNAMRIYCITIQEISQRNLAENLTSDDIDEIYNTDVLSVGITISEIKEVMHTPSLSPNTKREKYIRIVIKFLNSKFRIINIAKTKLQGRLAKINAAKTDFIQMIESSENMNAEQTVEKWDKLKNIINSTDDPEIKNMAKIALNIIAARKNFDLARNLSSLLERTNSQAKKTIREITPKIENSDALDPQEREKYFAIAEACGDFLQRKMDALENEHEATKRLIKELGEMNIIETAPQRVLMEKIEELEY